MHPNLSQKGVGEHRRGSRMRRGSRVPSRLRKLGRMAVWLVAGGQFVDLIWRERA
jgi:hypothetical protein